MMNQTLALLGMPGWAELVLLAAVGVLIFGKRLPEVGRSIGRSIVEFKKGIAGIEDDIDKAAAKSSKPHQIDQQASSTSIDSPQSSPQTSTHKGSTDHTS